jgi:hypothetical protein
MARQSHDREDLLAEATALAHRVEVTWPGLPRREAIVCGFRANGCASIYFSADWALHFDSRHRLRRAYIDGLLIVADAGQLSSLRRQRAADEVQLVRRQLTPNETSALLFEAGNRLRELGAALAGGEAVCGRNVWPEGEPRSDIVAWINSLTKPLQIANAPHAR